MQKGKKQNRRYFLLYLILALIVALAAFVSGIFLKNYQDQKKLNTELNYRMAGIEQLEQEKYEEAVESFLRALDQHKGEYTELEEDISLYLAQAQSSSGNAVDAISVYNDFIMQERGGYEVYYLRGRAYLTMGNEEAAWKDFSKAAEGLETVQEEGDSEEAGKWYELLGLGALQAEEYEQALDYFEKGLACGTIENKDRLWSGKISALEYLRDFKQAKKEMKQYLIEYPEDEHAQREYLFLKTR